MSGEKETHEKTLEPRREARKTQLRESARQAWRSPALRRCLTWAGQLILGAALASGRVLGQCAPFGLALVGACGPGAGGFAALLGAVGGYLLTLGLDEALRYAACSILIFAVSFAFYDLSIYQKGWFMPLSAALLDLLTGFATLQPRLRLRPTAYLPLLVAEFALTALSAYAFRVAFTRLDSRREQEEPAPEAALRQQVCLVLLAMAVLISLADVQAAGLVSLGRLLGLWLTLWAGYTAGPGNGAAVGLCVGLAMDLAGQNGWVYALTFGFSGLAGGLLRKKGRFAATLSCVLAGAAAALWSWERLDPVRAAAELLLGGGLFLVTPQRVLDRLSALFSANATPSPAACAAQTAQQQLHAAAGAFAQVFSALKGALGVRTAGQDEDPAVIYDRAANKVCAGCALRERCWQSQYQDTHDLLNAALPALLAQRKLSLDLLPQRFRDRCVKLPSFVAAVNEELHAYLLRRQYGRQVGRSRQAVCRQYAQVAEVLEEAAAAMTAPCALHTPKTRRLSQFLAARELRCQGSVYTGPQGRLRIRLTGPDAAAMADPTAVSALSSALEVPLALTSQTGGETPETLLRQQEPLAAVVGVAGRKKTGNEVSGDACAWFKDDSGLLYLLLCDGMGTGRGARRESELAIDLLEKFLKAGFSPENALKTLDQAFCLRLEEGAGFSTVDLLVLDLFSGAGSLYKLGSAPSYIKQGGTVKALRGVGFPAGMAEEAGAEAAPPPLRVRLGPGDCLALLTDGVFDEQEDDLWLREALMAFEGESPAALADAVVSREGAGEDDKTALVLRVTLRDIGSLPEGDKKAV